MAKKKTSTRKTSTKKSAPKTPEFFEPALDAEEPSYEDLLALRREMEQAEEDLAAARRYLRSQKSYDDGRGDVDGAEESLGAAVQSLLDAQRAFEEARS